MNNIKLDRRVAAAAVALSMLMAACQPVRPVDESGRPIGAPAVVVLVADAGAAVAEENGTGGTEDVAEAGEAAAAAEASDSEAGAPDAALVAAGTAVYHAQYCGICHELAAAGTTGRFGPPHNHIAVTAATRLTDPRYAGNATTAEEYLYESLVEPATFIVEGYVGTSHAMPPYTHLSDEDLRALVAYLMSQQ